MWIEVDYFKSDVQNDNKPLILNMESSSNEGEASSEKNEYRVF